MSFSCLVTQCALLTAVVSALQQDGSAWIKEGSIWRFSRWGSIHMSFSFNVSEATDLFLVHGKMNWQHLDNKTPTGVLHSCLSCTTWEMQNISLTDYDLYSLAVLAPQTAVRLFYSVDVDIYESCWDYTRLHAGWSIFATLPSLALAGLLARAVTRRFFPTDWQQPPPWDDNFVPVLTSCQRPFKPAEPVWSWWRHTWPYTWVCLPWHNDTTTRSQRVVVLLTEIMMTALLSQVYTFSQGFPTIISGGGSSSNPIDPDQLSGYGFLIISAASSMVNLCLRNVLVAWLKMSCQAYTGSGQRCVARALAVFLAASVIIVGAIVPLALSMINFSCRRIKVIMVQTLLSELTRGLFMGFGMGVAQYVALRRFGRQRAPEESEASIHFASAVSDSQISLNPQES